MPAPVLLYACIGIEPKRWIDAFRLHMPELEVRQWPDMGDPADIEYVLAWKLPPSLLQTLPNLKVIFSLGAGVEQVLSDHTLPTGVPLVRMVDPGLTTGMIEFVLLSVLRYHRRLPEYEANQKVHRWQELVPKLPQEQRVGLMGMGELGAACAQSLVALGFDVAGWSRSPKTVAGVTSFHGPEGLIPFLNRTDMVVCLLPLTAETDSILNAQTLAALPRGAFVINVARGRHVVEEDLLAALDSGQIAGATLDVFRREPLPSDHPFWSHPRVTVMPHSAALTQPKTAARTIADNIRRHQSGQPLRHVVDRRRGY